jgi:S-adenosylmethionine hydrolase
MTLQPDRNNKPIVVQITDFGSSDIYLYEIALTLHSYVPPDRIQTLSNDISPGDVNSASYLIGRARSGLRPGDVVLAVVDPGVGGVRQPVAIENGGIYFVGPDNGVFSRVLDRTMPIQVRSLGGRSCSSQVSNTFHGRDIFAPAAGRLASGVLFESLGTAIELTGTPVPLKPILVGGREFGHFIYIDRFGNAITDLTPVRDGIVVLSDGMRLKSTRSYSEIPTNSAAWLISSDGRVEIACNGQRADSVLRIEIGSRIIIEQSEGV